MTTTGGPEQSFADPASGTRSDDPVIIDRGAGPLDGDDIVVESGPPGSSHPRRRTRALLVGVVVVALIAGGIGIALATRGTGGATKLKTDAPVRPPAAHPTPVKSSGIRPGAQPKPTPAKVTPKRVGTLPVANSTPPAATPPVVTTPPPPVTTPPVESPSVLQWHATPSALSIKAGAHQSFTVSVINPTAGTVDLPHPLSCPPSLVRANGVAVGFAVCVDIVQVMRPHQTLARHYTIYATKTADASGQPLVAGSYTARVENLFNVKVTVTKS